MPKSKVRILVILMSTIHINGWTEYVTKYASKESVDDAGNDSNDSDEMSSVGSFDDDDDDEPAGTMDEV